MKYNRFGKTGLKISNLALGTMAFGRWIDEAQSFRVIDSAMDAGINILDTADFYGPGQDLDYKIGDGTAEIIIGKALKGRRDKMLIETKLGCRMGAGENDWGFSRQHIMNSVEASLKRLQTDYIDIYKFHYWDRSFPIDEAMRAMDDLVRQGKIRYIGCGDFAAWEIAKANGIAESKNLSQINSVQTSYNLLNRKAEEELVPFCKSEGISMFIYAPYAKGMLTGIYENMTDFPPESRAAIGEQLFFDQYLNQANIDKVKKYKAMAADYGKNCAQFTLSWILNQPTVATALIGLNKPEHITDAVTISEWTWDAELMNAVSNI